MDLVDITTWSSFETKEIAISQIFLDAPLKLTVREFTPMDGDMLEETWKSGDSTIVHSLPRYAIVEMNEAACTIGSFIDKSIGAYITAMVDGPDNLLWCTYMMAFKQVSTAQTVEEQILLRDCFRLWVSCLMTSYPNHIVGHERLGSDKIRDPLSQHFGMTPIPLLMVAQMECIHYTKFLRPLSKKVLDSLQDLVLSSKKRQKAWFTIYLTLFVLLHGCALVTRRDAETATQYGLTPYANPKSIQAHQSGAQTMLAHWHYVDKGLKPFQMALTSEGLKEVAKRANLNPEQTDLVRTTATWIRDQGKRNISFCADYGAPRLSFQVPQYRP
ncbi:hypothetical protein BM221_005088 [Beauveria bassiana]|uniref:Uncharacterized protein n=1 Tax=Beauveria bassiana TaxID=176275 RepID=A0A2N6NML1_BEABA|nr:hypothetical protein BM221_005088 [Beauveria bassiana]